MAWGSPAPVGSEVSIYMDTQRNLMIGDFIRTRSGRLYQILHVREQQRGAHGPRYDSQTGHKVGNGRQHLKCEVMKADMALDDEDVVHAIFWYGRNG